MHCTPEPRFHIRPLGQSSDVYGPCEVCGKHAHLVYQQTKEVPLRLDEKDSVRLWRIYPSGVAWAPAGDIYGHWDCLRKARSDLGPSHPAPVVLADIIGANGAAS